MDHDRKIRILIIENDAGFRGPLRLHPSVAGCAPGTAADGAEGGFRIAVRVSG